jgi:hypothetical protein
MGFSLIYTFLRLGSIIRIDTIFVKLMKEFTRKAQLSSQDEWALREPPIHFSVDVYSPSNTRSNTASVVPSLG